LLRVMPGRACKLEIRLASGEYLIFPDISAPVAVIVAAMLFGRETETSILRELVTGAWAGRSGALVLRGEPGIGKTALLELAVELMSGGRVLRVRGVEAESEIAFAGLQELFGSVMDRLGELPDRQRAVLAGALAVGPPVAGDPLAVRVATLSLLATVAETGPVLVAVDDAHWVDPASGEALAFAARRLGSEGIVALFAMRDAEPSAFDGSGVPQLAIGGLPSKAAHALLAENVPVAIAPAVARRLVQMSGGNPLAMREMAASVSVEQLAGRDPLPELLPVGKRLERAFMRRLEPLPAESRTALLVAAAGSHDEPGAVASAMESIGISPAALQPAEAAGLITIVDGVVEFSHPVWRSVVYRSASPDERRSAHAALAKASGGTEDRRAWHLAAAATGPDEHVAAALEHAARRALERGGLSTADRTFERAAALSVDRGARARRLLAAANLAYAAGTSERASALVDAGLRLADDATTRAELEHLAGVVERTRGSALRSHRILVQAASRVTRADPDRAVVMLLDAWFSDITSGNFRRASVTARRARSSAESCSPGLRRLAAAAEGTTAAFRGKLPAREVDMEAAAAAVAAAPDLPPPATRMIEVLSGGYDPRSGEPADAQHGDPSEGRIARAREEGALGLLPWLLVIGADSDFREDRWTRSLARAVEAAELAGELGQPATKAWALAVLARTEAARGQASNCRIHGAEADRLTRALDLGLQVHIRSSLGLLELGLGNHRAAAEQLERCAQAAEAYDLACPPVVPYEADLVEALRADGRERDAGAATERLQRRAERSESDWGLAAAARCRGILAPEDQFEAEFQTALELHVGTAATFERARTELSYGERLRRARRRADARAQLTSALATFERLEAVPWIEQARRELLASGHTARKRGDPTAVDQLTPQELRVALIIANGATIREAALQLFLSPKTIEAHLGHVYRKLGVKNRAQLARAVAAQEPVAA
jgi:DNA-binding CsgD family transcriptional regulator